MQHFPVLRLRQENVASECIRSHYVMPLGLVFFWHKRNGGGGWNEASFCIVGWQALRHRNVALRNEDDAVPDAGRFAKMCARKNQQKGWVGKAAKRPRSLEERKAGIFAA